MKENICCLSELLLLPASVIKSLHEVQSPVHSLPALSFCLGDGPRRVSGFHLTGGDELVSVPRERETRERCQNGGLTETSFLLLCFGVCMQSLRGIYSSCCWFSQFACLLPFIHN